MPTATQPAITPELAIANRDFALENLLREMETTKKVIAAIPDAKRDYRPDPNARTAWELAWHIASVDVQFANEIADGKFSMEERFKNEAKTVADLVAWYDKNVRAGYDRLRKLNGEQLTRILDFYGAFQLPAVMYLNFMLVHAVHHRGQLSTYLRPMGGKVPSIYGGSYDEPWKG